MEDRKKLDALITFHGGVVQKEFSAKTTHLVCGVAAGNIYNKASALVKSGTLATLVIVTPDWVLDCARAKSLVDSKIYNPRYLKIKEVVLKSLPTANMGPGQAKAGGGGGSLQSIIGFDFEESIAKTEVPTSSQKQQQQQPSATMQGSTADAQKNQQQTVVQQSPQQTIGAPQAVGQAGPIQAGHQVALQQLQQQKMLQQQQQMQTQMVRVVFGLKFCYSMFLSY